MQKLITPRFNNRYASSTNKDGVGIICSDCNTYHMMEYAKELESETAKLVYLFISQHDSVTAKYIKDKLGLKFMTVYTVLSRLQELSFIEQIEPSSGYRVQATDSSSNI